MTHLLSGEQVAKRTASCTLCQPPGRQRFLAATTGGRSVDYAVPWPKRRERFGNVNRDATTQDLPSTTRCWTKVTMKAVARKRQAMVHMTKRQHCNVHLAKRRECRGGKNLAATSFLQPSSCRALVLDGSAEECGKRQSVDETCILRKSCQALGLPIGRYSRTATENQWEVACNCGNGATLGDRFGSNGASMERRQ